MAAAATTPHHDDHHAPEIPVATVNAAPIRTFALVAAVVGLIAFAVLGVINYMTDPAAGSKDFLLTYEVGFVFWASVPLGSLALLMIAFLTSASWGVVLRRILQASVRTIWVIALLGLPMVAGVLLSGGKFSPFWWTEPKLTSVPDSYAESIKDADEERQAEERKEYEDEVGKLKAQGWGAAEGQPEATSIARSAAALHTKPEAIEETRHKLHDYLSPGFFTVRYVAYFALVGLLAWGVLKTFRRIEEDDGAAKPRLIGLSGAGMIVWVLSMTVVCTDWVMSVEETWASSMFPFIYGFNQFLTTLTFSSLVLYCTVKAVPGQANPANLPDLSGVLKDKFRIDIGTLTLGFTMAWAYGSFCQFMLIWAGNMPEEITYYLKRGGNSADGLLNGIGVTNPNGVTGYASGWVYLTYILMAFHWLLPFIVLLFREVKTSPRGMKIMTVLLLSVCACDVIWWIVPALPHERTWLHVPMAIAAIAGVGGVWAFFFSRELTKRPILPVNYESRFLANWGHH